MESAKEVIRFYSTISHNFNSIDFNGFTLTFNLAKNRTYIRPLRFT